MMPALPWVARRGVAEPEGGAVWAAAKNLLAQGLLAENERIVLFNTGSGFKYL